MMKLKRVPLPENIPREHSVTQHDRPGRFLIMLSCLLWLAVLMASPRARAAELDCLVKPEMYVELSSPVDSVMEQVLVDTGDTVTRGQPLVQLEASVERAKVKLAKLQAKSVSDIKNRKEQLRYAKQYHARMANLLSQNSVLAVA